MKDTELGMPIPTIYRTSKISRDKDNTDMGLTES
jgi:hypothetical protein